MLKLEKDKNKPADELYYFFPQTERTLITNTHVGFEENANSK